MTSRNFVSRRTFAITVALLVVMQGASDSVLWNLSRGPSAAAVKTQIDNEINTRSAHRDSQTCILLSAEPRTPKTQSLRHRFHCSAALRPKPAPTRKVTVTPRPRIVVTSGPPRLIVTPGPTITVTKMRHPKHHPGKKHPTPKPTPTCSTVEVDGMCLPIGKGNHLGQIKHPKH